MTMSMLKALKLPHKTQIVVMTVVPDHSFLGGLSLDLFRASERSARQEKQREQAANLVETAIRELSPPG
jgi:hypothetical protein